MQYKAVGKLPTTFNIGSGELSSLLSLSDEIEELASSMMDGSDDKRRTRKVTLEHSQHKGVIDVERSSAARAAGLSSNNYLRWSAVTSMKEGAARLLAWHVDRALPFFPPATGEEGEVDYSWQPQSKEVMMPLDGESMLSKLGLPSCSTHDDPMCLHEANSKLPCASECSTQSCLPSVFDSVISTTHYATEDCEVVMYTMMLGYDVVEMDLQTEFSDGEQQEEWKETTVCTIAFVPSESALVRNIIAQVPPKELLKRGVKERGSHERKV